MSEFALHTPLKWAGGKRWLVPYLSPLWERSESNRFVEPFCGGLSVTLGLGPKHALINDINPHTVNFFHHLKTGLKITLPMKYDHQQYYSYRDEFNHLIHKNKAHTKKGVSLFYYLNRTCYNGLCRFNQKGEFNVPFGRYKTVRFIRDFAQYQSAMRHWDFKNHDFSQLSLNEHDFVYADPPYDVEFTQYSRHTFGWEEQVRLVEWLKSHDGPAVLSNQATPRIVKLYQQAGFRLRYLKVSRTISCNKMKRVPVKEVLAFHNIADSLLQDISFKKNTT